MNAKITIGTQKNIALDELADMYRFRAKVFGERMGWEVAVLSGMEIDDYDALAPHYMLIHDDANRLCGCWRLLPTQGPYMLRNTFSQLLHGEPAPVAPDVWELSRFAIVSHDRPGYGFADLALDAMRESLHFASRMGISRYVTVTTTAVERLMKKAGIEMRRFGPPLRVGIETAVALTIDLGERTQQALFAHLAEPA